MSSGTRSRPIGAWRWGYAVKLLVKTGRPQEGCRLRQAAELRLKAARNGSHDTYIAGAYAEGLAASGSIDEALTTIDRAIEESNRRGGTWDLPELMRLKGALLAERSTADPRAVEALLRRHRTRAPPSERSRWSYAQRWLSLA